MPKTVGTLYFSYGTRGSKILWLGHILGVEFDHHVLNMGGGEHKAADYVDKNPHGAVPTLETDDFCFWESAAIAQYLIDNFDPEHKIGGAPGSTLRNTFLNYNALSNEAESHAIPVILHKMIYPEAMRKPEIAEAKAKRFRDSYVVFYKRLLEGRSTKYAAADHLTAVDAVVGYVLNIAERAGIIADEPALGSYVEAIRQTEHFKVSFLAPENR